MKKSSLGIILAGSIFLAIVEVKISIALSQSETLYYFFVRLFEFFSLTYAVYTAILIPLNFAIIYLLFIRQLEKNSQKNGYVRSNPPQDRLERTGLAKNISLKIAHQSLDESLIIGINGRWGSGKTTLADYICKDIETAETNIKIIRYDAWSYPSSEDMSIAFLNELANCIASSIQTKGGKILRRELFNYLEALKKYKNFDLNNTTLNLSHLFSNEGGINLKLMKNELHETFKQNNFRCLVVIDDIDRLDPTQTINIFQTIKNLCDFGGVSYLVLYDKLQVMNCLSFNKIYDGEEYLAKIIEHEVLLPPPAPHQIYELLDSQLLSFTGYNSPRTINPADY